MIGDVLIFLKDQLNSHFKSLSITATEGVWEDKAVFLEGDAKGDAASFKIGAITVLLYRIEQETALRQGDPYLRVAANGSTQKAQPALALNLYVMFVARFKDYAQGLHYLSQVIQFFQSQKIFNCQNAPGLSPAVGELAVDWVSLSSQQQNELWGLLRTSYLPSVVYKIRAVTFLDDNAAPTPESIAELALRGLS